jgi:hypothetical protein
MVTENKSNTECTYVERRRTMEFEIITIKFCTVTIKETCFSNPRLPPTERHGFAEPSLNTNDK